MSKVNKSWVESLLVTCPKSTKAGLKACWLHGKQESENPAVA